jgi:hypothetical protein
VTAADPSGIASGRAILTGPASRPAKHCLLGAPVEGSATNGTSYCGVSFTAADVGTWTLSSLTVTDTKGNQRVLGTAGLAALGFPTVVTVTN